MAWNYIIFLDWVFQHGQVLSLNLMVLLGDEMVMKPDLVFKY